MPKVYFFCLRFPRITISRKGKIYSFFGLHNKEEMIKLPEHVGLNSGPGEEGDPGTPRREGWVKEGQGSRTVTSSTYSTENLKHNKPLFEVFYRKQIIRPRGTVSVISSLV